MLNRAKHLERVRRTCCWRPQSVQHTVAMRTRAPVGLPLPVLRALLRNPMTLLDGLTAARTRLGREATAVLAAIHALPRLVLALERLGPTGDALNKLAKTTTTLEALANDIREIPQAQRQLHALHEQIVAVACDLRALEPEIERLAKSTASLDRSIQVLTRAFGPIQTGSPNNSHRDDRRAPTPAKRRS